ncbi:MAG: hypothetical protein PHF31_07475 [Methylobacter sp.]|nr:hypothetical protein [Methylobacter sp.]
MQRHAAAWIRPDQAKTAKAIGVLLNDDVVAVLKALKHAGIERFR